jgi:hypothetical protein
VGLADSDLVSEVYKPILKYQTFRMSLSSKFGNLKEICFNLWDLKERAKEFHLKFVENESLTKVENEDYASINDYLKLKSNSKKALFVLTNIKKISKLF